MNSLLSLGWRLGDVPTVTFQRHYHSKLVRDVEHYENIAFDYKSVNIDAGLSVRESTSAQSRFGQDGVVHIAHQAGTNCLTIDQQTQQYLLTGGADSTIRIWDLQSHDNIHGARHVQLYDPIATLTRAHPSAHTHAITSISVYPFDDTPTTVLSTSYDKSILLSKIAASGMEPLLKVPLDFTPFTHNVCPDPSAEPLVAIGTSHSAVRLLDLRTGLATHSLPGHNGAVYSVAFHPSPRHAHIVISGAADGRILFFDIRRANAAFASLDVEDVAGFSSSTVIETQDSRPRHLHLNYGAQAHSGPVTGLSFNSDGSKLISAGHDSRLRVWDMSTGRNELVHFGPRIRNTTTGNRTSMPLPAAASNAGKEFLLWPNDDGRGEIFMHDLYEGTLEKVLKTRGVDRSNTDKRGKTTTKLTSKGKINQLAVRYRAAFGDDIEIYSAHGDGSVCVWKPIQNIDENDELGFNGRADSDTRSDGDSERGVISKKRKRDLIGDLVQGLTKKPAKIS